MNTASEASLNLRAERSVPRSGAARARARHRRATIGTGAFAGAMALGLVVSLGVAFDRSGCRTDPMTTCAPEGNPIAGAAIIGFGALTGVGVLVFAIVGGQLHEHREPLRRWKAALAPGGLQLRF